MPGSTADEACTRQTRSTKSAGALMALAGIAAVAGGGVLREQAFSMSALAMPAAIRARRHDVGSRIRSAEHTSELQSIKRTSYAVFFLKKKNTTSTDNQQ